jgi:hypothetical protein
MVNGMKTTIEEAEKAIPPHLCAKATAQSPQINKATFQRIDYFGDVSDVR